MNMLFQKKLQENPFVYHYTSLEGLFAILEGYRINHETGCLPFKASCIYNANDPREMELGFYSVKKYLPSFEEKSEYNMHLSDIYNYSTYENKCIEEYNSKPEGDMIEQGMVPYITSFSCLGDFLPMWSMYGNNKKGVCLKFDTSKLIKEIGGPIQFDFVSYDGDRENHIMKEHFSILYKEQAKRCCNEQVSIEEKVDILSVLCQCVSPFIKCNEWEYEKEFGIVYRHKYGPHNDEDYINSIIYSFGEVEKIKIQPYFLYPIKANSLDSIIIGPLLDYNIIVHIVRNELKECKLPYVKVSPSSIQIR